MAVAAKRNAIINFATFALGTVLGKCWALAKAKAQRRILELAKLLPPTARKLQSNPNHRFANNALVEQIVALIEQRCGLTIRRLTKLDLSNNYNE